MQVSLLEVFYVFCDWNIWFRNQTMYYLQWQGRIQGGGRIPPKIGKNIIFLRKIVRPPNLKSWVCPAMVCFIVKHLLFVLYITVIQIIVQFIFVCHFKNTTFCMKIIYMQLNAWK